MKIKFRYIIIAILILYHGNVYSQVNCEVPAPPILTLVSVEPETGITNLEWTLSPSDKIAAYILYTFKDGDGMAFHTIWNPSATNFSYSSTSSKYFSVWYVVAAYRVGR